MLNVERAYRAYQIGFIGVMHNFETFSGYVDVIHIYYKQKRT